MDRSHFAMFNKSSNCIRRLLINRENFHFSNKSFLIWWVISGMEVMKKPKISAQYL